MIVQYRDRHDVVAEFDPESGELTAMPRPANVPITATEGWFGILDGVCVVFFRRLDRLWLRVGSRLFDLDSNSSGLAPNGTVQLYNSSGSVNAIGDVGGWYGAPGH